MTTQHDLGLLEGYLTAKEAPLNIMQALTRVSCQMEMIMAGMIDSLPAMKSAKKIVEERIGELDEQIKTAESKTDEEKVAEFLAKPVAVKVRKKPDLSPEQRQAASDRMKATMARIKSEKEAASQGVVGEGESDLGNTEPDGTLLSNGVRQNPDGSFTL